MKKIITLIIMLVMCAIPLIGMWAQRALNTTEGETAAIIVSGMIAEVCCVGIILFSNKEEWDQ